NHKSQVTNHKSLWRQQPDPRAFDLDRLVVLVLADPPRLRVVRDWDRAAPPRMHDNAVVAGNLDPRGVLAREAPVKEVVALVEHDLNASIRDELLIVVPGVRETLAVARGDAAVRDRLRRDADMQALVRRWGLR